MQASRWLQLLSLSGRSILDLFYNDGGFGEPGCNGADGGTIPSHDNSLEDYRNTCVCVTHMQLISTVA